MLESASAEATLGMQCMSRSQVDGGFWMQLPHELTTALREHFGLPYYLRHATEDASNDVFALQVHVCSGALEARHRDGDSWSHKDWNSEAEIILSPKVEKGKVLLPCGASACNSVGLSGGWRGFAIAQVQLSHSNTTEAQTCLHLPPPQRCRVTHPSRCPLHCAIVSDDASCRRSTSSLRL